MSESIEDEIEIGTNLRTFIRLLSDDEWNKLLSKMDDVKGRLTLLVLRASNNEEFEEMIKEFRKDNK